MVHILILSTSNFSTFTEDQELDVLDSNVRMEQSLIVNALKKKDSTVKISKHGWDDTTINWDDVDVVLFREIWDYFDRFPEFKIWFEETLIKCQKKQIKSLFLNSISLVKWNLDKHYLLDLKAKDISIVPSHFVEMSEMKEKNLSFLDYALKYCPWDDFVVKPTVSGAARETYHLNKKSIPEDISQIYDELNLTESFLFQPFVQAIVDEGEISVIVINGKVTHGILKKVQKGDFRVQDDFGGTIHLVTPTEEQAKFALKSVSACPETPLYARVDIVRNTNDLVNNWMIGELEIIEPELWFRYCHNAADELAIGLLNAAK